MLKASKSDEEKIARKASTNKFIKWAAGGALGAFS